MKNIMKVIITFPPGVRWPLALMPTLKGRRIVNSKLF